MYTRKYNNLFQSTFILDTFICIVGLFQDHVTEKVQPDRVDHFLLNYLSRSLVCANNRRELDALKVQQTPTMKLIGSTAIALKSAEAVCCKSCPKQWH